MAITLNAKATSYPSFQVGKGGVTIYQGTSLPSNSNGNAGDFYIYANGSNSELLQKQGSTWTAIASGGNVSGPLVSTNNAIATYNGTTGEVIQNTGVLIDASNNVTGLNNLTANGTLGGSNFSGTSSGTNTGDQTITLTGDVTGSGTASLVTTLANSGVTAGTYNILTVNAKGLVTSGSNVNYVLGTTATTNAIPTFSNSAGTQLQNTNVTIDSNNTITVNKDSSNIRNAKYLMWNTTTDNTQTQLFLDGVSQQLVLQNNTTMRFRMQLVGRATGVTGTSLVASYEGAITRESGASSTAILGNVTSDISTLPNNLDWTVSISADTSHGALEIQVTGDVSTNITWSAAIETMEVTG